MLAVVSFLFPNPRERARWGVGVGVGGKGGTSEGKVAKICARWFSCAAWAEPSHPKGSAV